MEKQEERIGGSAWPKNKLKGQGESIQDGLRPAMMYSAETWAVKKAQEKKLDLAEMRMSRWMSGSRLTWYGHVLRRRICWQEIDGDVGAEEGKEKHRPHISVGKDAEEG